MSEQNCEKKDVFTVSNDYAGNPFEVNHFINKNGKKYIHDGLKYSTIEERVLKMCESIHLDVRIDSHDTVYVFDKDNNSYVFFAKLSGSESDLVDTAIELLKLV